MEWQLALAMVSVALASSASLTAWLAQYARRQDMRKQEETLTRASFDSAVKTNELEQLGRLLEKELGSVSIAEYARNPRIRAEFRSIFGDIAEFVGDAELESANGSEESGSERASDSTSRVHRAESGDSEIDRALSDVIDGEVWNGLARARRRLESELLDIAQRHAANVGERKMSAGQLLSLVSSVGVVSGSTSRDLRYALQVANSGIHGSDVEIGQALEAIWLIDRFLQEGGASRSGAV